MRIALFAATAAFLIAAAPPTKQRLLSIMHDRHEGMEAIGKNFNALHREMVASAPDVGVMRA